ncbi:hypothetical protein LguiA_013552 [Lonicera macranthoides]
MSTYNSLKMDHFSHTHTHQNPNPNFAINNIDTSDFEVSDYLILDDGSSEDFSQPVMVSPENVTSQLTDFSGRSTPRNSIIKCGNGVKKNKADLGFRVAFRTKSDLEVMDDGFKWRKYGKKMVKNNLNPRNYYKCSSGGCKVKKRVERESEDRRYVITTYEGVHNHESPCVVYYNHTPLMIPDGWTLQANSSSYSSSS